MICRVYQMLATKRTLAILTLGCTVLLNTTALANVVVEVKLVSFLDDTRGFCIDILGPRSRAKVEGGLQAHTCYSYQGEIGIDQTFDHKLISGNTFYLPGFDVCMTASSVSSGASLGLQACKSMTTQQFELRADGSIRPNADTSLCVTVSAEISIKGGGGKPTHLKRPLALLACEQSMAEFQTWSLNLL